jgi:hypothetical protein
MISSVAASAAAHGASETIVAAMQIFMVRELLGRMVRWLEQDTMTPMSGVRIS